MTIRRAKPLGRGTPPRRSRLKQGKGAKAERETPALDAFRFAVYERARGFCEVMVISDPQKPFPFYEIINSDDRRMICGIDSPHPGDNAHHVWPEDRDGGIHVPERGLYLCWRAHRWVHDHVGKNTLLGIDGQPVERTAKTLGLLRPEIPEGPS